MTGVTSTDIQRVKTVGHSQGFLAGLLVLSGAIATTVSQVWFIAGKPPKPYTLHPKLP